VRLFPPLPQVYCPRRSDVPLALMVSFFRPRLPPWETFFPFSLLTSLTSRNAAIFFLVWCLAVFLLFYFFRGFCGRTSHSFSGSFDVSCQVPPPTAPSQPSSGPNFVSPFELVRPTPKLLCLRRNDFFPSGCRFPALSGSRAFRSWP